MDLSPLQQERYQYKPKLPALLKNRPTEIKAVKGGSFQSETVSASETGIHFALWSSPFTGFRVVLERR